MNDKTVTFSQAGNGMYNVMIQNRAGRVIVNKRGISRREAMFIIEQNVTDETEMEHGNTEQ